MDWSLRHCPATKQCLMDGDFTTARIFFCHPAILMPHTVIKKRKKKRNPGYRNLSFEREILPRRRILSGKSLIQHLFTCKVIECET